MNISIATMGFFNPAGSGEIIAGGGGAPPYKQNEEETVKIDILIYKVEMVTINSPNKLNKIDIKLKDDVLEVL